MKIIHIVICLQGGGIQNFLLSLLPEQVKLGNDVTLIVVEKHSHEYCFKLEKILRDKGVKVICLDKTRGSKLSFMRTLISCRKFIRKMHPDIVNTHGGLCHIYGALSVACSGIKHCITIHNAPEKWDMLNNLLNKNKYLIFCSQAAFEMRVQKNKNITAIDNGVSADIIRTNAVVDLRKELRLKPDDKIIISVGSLRPQKNYEFLKSIVDTLGNPHIHFCVCGGNYGAGYISTDLFKDYPNIHFLGLRSDVSAIENGSNLFLSCATFEGLPIAVLEAYFNGIPCVLSPIIQHKKIAEGIVACYIPDNFKPEDFVVQINKALTNKKSHDEIYLERKDSLYQYSISNTARKYIEYYKTIK